MSIEACAELVQKGDQTRFLSAMSGDVSAREKLFPLYAFNLEIARAPWVTKEPMIAEMRLQWWLDVIEEIYTGKETRSHEVSTPLSKLVRSTGLPREAFDQMINARKFDIYQTSHENDAGFHQYIRHTSGNLMLLAASSLAQTSEKSVVEFGEAVGIANLFLAIPKLVNAQKHPLMDGTPDGVRNLAKDAKAKLIRARKSLKSEAKEIRPALRAGYLALPVLNAAIARPEAVLEDTLLPPEGISKLRLFWLSLVNGF